MAEARRHLGAGAALSVIVQGGPLLAGATLSIVLARTIGPSANGRFALLGTLVGLVSLLASLSLNAGIVYEVSRRRWSVRSAFRTSYEMGLALGLAGICAGVAFFALTHGSVYKGIPFWLALVALATLPPLLAYGYADSVLLGRERYEGYAFLELSHSATFLLVGVGLALAFGVSGAIAALPAAAFVGAVVGVVLLRRESRRDAVVDRAGALGRAVRFGLQSWGANLLQQINYRFDVLILGAFASTRDVGVYAVALTISSTAWILPQALQTVLFPRVAGLHEATLSGELSVGESDASLAKAVRHGVILTIPAGLVISVLLLVGVPLAYGPRFHETTLLGFVILPGTLMLGVGKILSSAVAGKGYPRYTLYSAAISTPLTCALYFGLIPFYRAWGGAIGSSISYGVTAFLALFFFKRISSIPMAQLFIPRLDDLTDYQELVHSAHAAQRARLARRSDQHPK
ncbi:MAG TPA: oligosaccharide flippase family protein [Gaiellaceae bacterium]|nr:oligosaccharide flippase family protein [Gaiellaceae bacterium]